MRPVKLTGTSKDKFEQIEKILSRFQWLMPQKVTAHVPPIPLSFYVEQVPEDEVVFRFIFPVAGAIKQAVVLVDDLADVKSCSFTALVHNELSSHSEMFKLTSRSKTLKLNMPVDAGMALTVKCHEPKLQGIWIGLLFAVKPNHAELVELAVDQMEQANARIHNQV